MAAPGSLEVPKASLDLLWSLPLILIQSLILIFKIIFKTLPGVGENPEPFNQTQVKSEPGDAAQFQVSALDLPQLFPNFPALGIPQGPFVFLGTFPGHKQQPKCY